MDAALVNVRQPPKEREELVPFRKLFGERANIVILLVLMCGALSLAFGLVGVIILLRRQLTEVMMLELIKLIGIVVTVATSMAVLLRSAGNAQGIERVEQKADVAARKTEVAAQKADVAAQKAEETHEHVRNGLSETVKQIKVQSDQTVAVVTDMAKKSNGAHLNAVREAGEQARQGERDQLLNDEGFRAALARDLCPMLAKEIARELRDTGS